MKKEVKRMSAFKVTDRLSKYFTLRQRQMLFYLPYWTLNVILKLVKLVEFIIS